MSTAANTTRPSEKHQKILDAAISVIAENGFFNSRISDIAARAGVADGTVYLYFKNKEELLMAAINRAFSSFMQKARAEVAGISDPRERLRRLAHLHLSSLGANRDMAVVFQMELRQSVKFVADFSHHLLVEYFAMIREAVREGQHAGIFRSGISDKIVANVFFGALDEMVTTWVLSEHDYPLAGATDAVMDMILNGLQTGK